MGRVLRLGIYQGHYFILLTCFQQGTYIVYRNNTLPMEGAEACKISNLYDTYITVLRGMCTEYPFSPHNFFVISNCSENIGNCHSTAIILKINIDTFYPVCTFGFNNKTIPNSCKCFVCEKVGSNMPPLGEVWKNPLDISTSLTAALTTALYAYQTLKSVASQILDKETRMHK